MKQPIVAVLLAIFISSVLICAKPSTTRSRDPHGLILKPIPDKTVVLTFDDGCLSHATYVAPLLKEYGFNATFYITEAMEFKSRKDWYMTWEQIKGLQDMGFEIGNHTVHHWGLSAHTLDNCIRTVVGMEELFQKHKVNPATTFCWPLYRVNNGFVPTLREKGYLFARGGHERAYDPVQHSPLDVPSFTIHDKALKKNPNIFVNAAEQAKHGNISVFCFHGVPDGEHPTVGLDPEKFEEMMNYLREHRYNVIAMRDMAQFVDIAKAALYLSRPLLYPWGGGALSWGWVTRKDNTLYIGIDKLPFDRKLTLPGMTTKIAKGWFLADAQQKAIPIVTSYKGIPTITVPDFSLDTYGTSPVIIAAELQGGPIATLLDFGFPGLPEVTLSGSRISVVVPKAVDLKKLAPVYKTGSPKVTGEPASGTACDFTKPQTYTITAADGTRRTYTVHVTQQLGAVDVANPSFETFDLLNRENGVWGINPKEAFWVFTQKHKNASVGIVSVESPHLMGIPPLDGSRHCGVVGGAGSSISQSVVFDEGRYTVSFDRTIPHRISGQFPTLHLTIDGRILLSLDSVSIENGWNKRAWKRHTSPVFTVTAGSHTIGFVIGDDADPSNYGHRGVNYIDNVTMNHRKR